MQDSEDIFKGKWFHTYNDTKEDPCYQGKVIQFFPPNYILTRVISRFGGFSEGQKMLKITNDFSFFRTQETMETDLEPKLVNYFVDAMQNEVKSEI